MRTHRFEEGMEGGAVRMGRGFKSRVEEGIWRWAVENDADWSELGVALALGAERESECDTMNGRLLVGAPRTADGEDDV